MFEVYYFNDHKARFFKTYKTERAAEIAVMSLKMEGIPAWIQEGQKSHMALFFYCFTEAIAGRREIIPHAISTCQEKIVQQNTQK